MPLPLQLTAIVRGSADSATIKIREAFASAGAWITDVHFFSGVYTVFAFEVAGRDFEPFVRALSAAGLEWSGASDQLLAHLAPTDDDRTGTIGVTFADGNPDVTHTVVAVPG